MRSRTTPPTGHPYGVGSRPFWAEGPSATLSPQAADSSGMVSVRSRGVLQMRGLEVSTHDLWLVGASPQERGERVLQSRLAVGPFVQRADVALDVLVEVLVGVQVGSSTF